MDEARPLGWLRGVLASMLLVIMFVLLLVLSRAESIRSAGGAPQQETGTASVSSPITFQLNPSHQSAVAISLDGSQIAYLHEANGKRFVVVNGTPGPQFDHIRAPWMIYDADIRDDRHLQAPQQILDRGLVFSPDGKHLAYVIGQWTKPGPILWQQARVAVVVDEKAGPFYDGVSLPVFSTDGAHVAYTARKGKQWVVVYDGEESEPYEIVANCESHAKVAVAWNVFAQGGSHIACAGLRNNVWHVIVDGKEGPGYQAVADLTFSPDGRHFAYFASRNNTRVLLLDGKEVTVPSGAVRPTFSPDGKRLAYLVRDELLYWVMLDGKKSAAFQSIQDLIFSPDGRHLAYAASTAGKSPRQVLILDGREVPLPPHYQIYGVQFSPDGRLLATFDYLNGGGGLLFGKQVIETRDLVFSPDGAHTAYISLGVYLDGKPLWMPFKTRPRELCFTPDGRHLVILYETVDHPVRYVSIDGRPGTPYDDILSVNSRDPEEPPRFVFFDAPDRYHYFAVKDGKVQRIEETIAP